MGDHLAFLVNRLLTESTLHAAIESRNRAKEVDEGGEFAFIAPKMEAGDILLPQKLVECRICQDEDLDSNMETPCSCCGSLKYAHRKCVQRWCNEKGDTICEICHEPFKPGYQAPPPLLVYGHIPINVRRSWQIRRQLAEAHLGTGPTIDEEALTNSSFQDPSSRNLIYRCIVAIIFVGLLVLRHTLPLMVEGSEFAIPLFLLAVLRISGILLLVYVTMVAVSGLRCHRHQEVNPTALYTSPDDEEDEERPNLQPPSHVILIP